MYDFLLYNAKIYPFTQDNAPYSSMLIQEGKIFELARGSNFQTDFKIQDIDTLIDAHKATIIPSFIYPHAHLSFKALFYNAINIAQLPCVKTKKKLTTNELLENMAKRKEHKRNTTVYYNFDPTILHQGETVTFSQVDAFFGNTSYAIFAKNLKSGFFSKDIFRALKLDYRQYGGVLFYKDMAALFEPIYTYLLSKQSPQTIENFINDFSVDYTMMGYSFLESIDGFSANEDDPALHIAEQFAEKSMLNVMTNAEPLKNYINDLNTDFLYAQPLSPLEQIQSYIERHPKRNTLPLLKRFTCDAADMLGIEEDKGRLLPRLDADMLLLSTDPIIPSKKRLKGTKIVAQILGGRLVYYDAAFFTQNE